MAICHSPEVFKLYCDQDVQLYLGGVLDDESAFNNRFRDILDEENAHNWAVTLEECGSFIGIVCFNMHHDKTDYEVGFKFLPAFWGYGYALETIDASIADAKAKLDLDSIVAETQSMNQRSKRLLEKLGFEPERTLMRHGEKQVFYRKTF